MYGELKDIYFPFPPFKQQVADRKAKFFVVSTSSTFFIVSMYLGSLLY